MKKLMKVVLMVIVLTVLVSACSPKAPASRWDAIKETGKIVVGTSADYEPWEYKDEDDNFVGIDMEIMREIGKRMGVEVEFQDLGFDALVTAVQEGKVDAAIAAMASTAERRETVDFSVMYYAGDNIMLKASDSDIAFTDPLEAASYKIGTQSGTIMQYWVENNLIDPGLMAKENMSLYERNEQVALDLQAGRIDIAVMDLEPGKQFMSDPAFGFMELWRGVMETEGQSIAIMQGEAALKAELDKHITDMLNEGFMDALFTEYGVE
ncbi:MAG: ABC transporter substrate-binding protein [Pelolinea sp.]|nr:ABC transporter substrate-binding protein [Pelolinea sp.]